MKTILLVLSVFTIISVQAQYTLTDDHFGTPVYNGDTIIATYDLTISIPEAVCYVNLHSTNMNDFRYQMLSTTEADTADNWLCVNLGLCYPPTTTDINIELLADSTRQLQLHYRPNGSIGDVIITYRVSEVGNSSNAIIFSVKYVGTTTSVSQQLADDSKIVAFPNPANQSTQIKYQINNNAKIYLYNNIGKIVSIYSVDKTEEFIIINTSELDNGIYFYQVVTNSNIKSKAKQLIVIH